MNKFDARQVISRDTLARIALATNTELDDLLRSLNSEATPPFHLYPDSSPSLTLNVGPSKVTNPITSRTRTINSIGADTPDLTSGTIVFPAASGGTVVVTPGNDVTLTVASGNWIKGTIYFDANNDLNILFGTEAASEALANALPAPDGTLAIGYVSIQNIGGTIQNITNSRIYQFVGVGGAGGTGDANAITETIKNRLLQAPFEAVTPVVFSQDEDAYVDGSSTGAYSIIDKDFKFTSIGQTFVSTQMVDSEFLASDKALDQVELLAFWDINDAGSLDVGTISTQLTQAGPASVPGSPFDQFDTWQGQKFTSPAVSSYVNDVTFSFRVNFGSPVGEAEVRIYKWVGSAPTTLIATSTNKLDVSTLTGSFSTFTFNFLPAYLESSTSYAAIVVPVGYTPSGFEFTIGTPSSSSFGGGVVVSTNGYAGGWSTTPTTDFVFVMNLNGDGAKYQVSRNGGNEWQSFQLDRVGETDLFRGIHTFTDEATNQTLFSQTTSDSSLDLDGVAGTQQELSQPFTVASGDKLLLKEVMLEMTKVGTPDGNVFIGIFSDNSGNPDVLLSETDAIAANSFTTGSNTINIPNVYLTEGTYHLKIRTDAAYKATYGGGTKLRVEVDTTGSTPYARKYNGTSWSVSSTNNFRYSIKGIDIDLRVRITSNVADVHLKGFGIFYDKQAGEDQLVTGERNIEVFHFSGDADETDFLVTQFLPDAESLHVYDVNTGQVYRHGVFSIEGQTVKFAAGQFYQPGQTIKLMFDQSVGGGYDNSDLNRALLAANHLGNPDGGNDLSSAGRGIYLRRPDGTLREISIDNSDNIVVSSV